MNERFSKFLNAYQTASQPIKDVIDSEKIGLFIDTILTDAAAKPKLTITISDRILGIISDSEMVSALEKIPGIQTDATIKIMSFINEVTVSDIKTSISEVEETLQNLPSIHTMATDSKQIGYGSTPANPPIPPTTETTYTSMQSAILNEGEVK